LRAQPDTKIAGGKMDPLDQKMHDAGLLGSRATRTD
jgi:hypothetical protein